MTQINVNTASVEVEKTIEELVKAKGFAEKLLLHHPNQVADED